MNGICRLCRQPTTLQESHVVPSFVFRWLKESSATGHLRSGMAWNKRVQDGLKRHWLCQQCEQRLGQWEKQFSERIFEPLNHGKASRFTYGSWLLKFAVSVSWRVLQLFRDEDLSHFHPELVQAADEALETWREVLLDSKMHPDTHEQHLFLGDFVSEHTFDDDMPANINRYMLRAVDLDAPVAGSEAIVYTKMCRVVLVGFITIRKPRHWQGTKIAVRHGTIGSQTYTLPATFGDYFLNRARKCEGFYKKITERQGERITRDYKRNMQRAGKSETWAAMDEDVGLFGDKAFSGEKRNDESETENS